MSPACYTTHTRRQLGKEPLGLHQLLFNSLVNGTSFAGHCPGRTCRLGQPSPLSLLLSCVQNHRLGIGSLKKECTSFMGKSPVVSALHPAAGWILVLLKERNPDKTQFKVKHPKLGRQQGKSNTPFKNKWAQQNGLIPCKVFLSFLQRRHMKCRCVLPYKPILP